MDREPSIRAEWEPQLHAAIAAVCKELKCPVYAISGVEDHVHALVRMHASVSIATLAGRMKGNSSHFINHVIAPPELFKWQESYAAFSVDKDNIDRVRAYILNQKQHHAKDTCIGDWERIQSE
jgi:REP element-mobilizing transposase RayT